MSSDAAEVGARIVELESALADRPEGSAEHRGTRVALAATLAARYVQHGGADEDRLRAERIARDVLADDAATPDQRQAMSMLLPTLTMVAETPAAALRGRGPAMDRETLRLTEEWQQSMDPAAMMAGLGRLFGQLDAIEDVESLPPQIRSGLDMMKAAMGLLADTQRPGWDGTVAPEVTASLRSAMEGADPGVPGVDMMRGLVTWVEGFDAKEERGARVAELETAIAGLSEDELLAPVLRADLAKELAGRADLGGRGGVERITCLLEVAAAGMPEDHPFRADTVRMLAGALVATAADRPGEAARERAAQIADEVLSAQPGDGPESLFLRALVGLMRSLAHGGRVAEQPLLDLVACIEVLPREHPLRPVAEGQLAAVLADRSLMAGLLEDADTSVHLMERAAAAVGAGDGSGALIACVSGITQVNQAVRLDDRVGLERASATLRIARDGLPGEHPMRPNVDLVLAVAELRTAVTTGAGVRAAVDSVRSAAASGRHAGVPAVVTASLVDTVDALKGLLDAEPAAVLAGIERMEAALAEPGDATPFQRAGQHALLGKAYLAALGTGAAPDGAAGRAVAILEEARRLVAEDSGVPLEDVLRDLSSALRAAGDRAASRAVAVEALQAHAGTVLLQSGAAHSIVAAQGAATDAARLSRWCLADGDLEGAVAAVELGRGLALHAATSLLRVPTLLTDIGRDDLASEWEADANSRRSDLPQWAVRAADGSVAPDLLRAAAALRHRVVSALRSAPQAAGLFHAPSAGAIGEAVRAVGADVLAYLLPGDENAGGHVLLVDRSGNVVALDAPRLRDEAAGELATYLRSPRPGSVGFTWTWRSALERLCDWAGPAVIAPLLEELSGSPRAEVDGVPRVVLVPCGRLAAVPWQAARRFVGRAGIRYACQDLVLSSTASARSLIDVASRPALPRGGDVVLVSDPTGRITGARDEVLALRAAFYPDAMLLGDLGESGVGGPGTPDEVLAQLPGPGQAGSPLLHLACHALATGDPGASYVALTPPLSVRTILDRAGGRPADAAGPTIVCSACETDFTECDHDEALTVATAFLTCGAVTVVGSRWAVSDAATAVSMFAFHHFLSAQGLGAADALRAAQLWMLDPARPVLPGMPAKLARQARRATLASVEMWAAFGHHGR